MLKQSKNIVITILSWLNLHRRIVIGFTAALILIPLLLIAISYLVIEPYGRSITTIPQAKHQRVGIVLGAGITKQGKPFRELQVRLDIAAAAVNAGTVDRLLLSGDNRYPRYNEPDAMRNYLVDVKHIPAYKLQPDYAGRGTYESCERARKVFGVSDTIIFSARSHLPRAIYLCQHFGIHATGISSNVEAANAGRREPIARVKALYNVMLSGEPTILGPPIWIR